VPAPAVIPALKVYINTVVVKTPVVNLRIGVVLLARSIDIGGLVCCESSNHEVGPRSLNMASLVISHVQGITGLAPFRTSTISRDCLRPLLWYNRKQINVFKAGIKQSNCIACMI